MAKKLAKKTATMTITARTMVYYEREMEVPANLTENELHLFISDDFDRDNLDWETLEYEHDYEVTDEQ